MTTIAETRGGLSNAVAHAVRTYLAYIQETFRMHEVGEMRWSEDPAESEIIVQEKGGSLDLPEIGNRPLILVQRGPIRTGGFMDRSGGTDFETGEEFESDILSTTMQIFCISKEGAEAESIAYYLQNLILSSRRELQQYGRFQKVVPSVTLSEEMPAGSLVPGDDWKMVVIGSPIVLQFRATIAIGPDHPHFRAKRAVNLRVQNRLGVQDSPETAAMEAFHRYQAIIRRQQ